MAYDVELADRIRKVVSGERGLSEERMFGGLAFLIDEKMAVSASSKGGLLLRIDPTQTVSLVSEPHVRPAEMRGRKMRWTVGFELMPTCSRLTTNSGAG